ncbi:MAG: TatD family hydrolase [Candidatus Uhrbacteria bacterium]|nr:TatD family hydrolase [Candidatus Uhrbacteria bacterium]
MIPRIIDSHSHFHFPAYDQDRQEIFLRMQETQTWTVTVGTNATTSQKAIEAANQYPGVFACVGYHPNSFTSSYEDPDEPRDTDPYSVQVLTSIATSSSRIVALGETGLDYYRMDEGLNVEEGKRRQASAFLDHIQVGQKLDLPIVIHCREAFDDLIRMLAEEKAKGAEIRGVIHCFTGSWELAQKLLDLGLYLSFTGIVTFKPRASDDPEQHIHRVIERMPLDRMMIETDAPWLAPEPYRGKRNEPSYVIHVAEQIAKLRNTSVDEICQATTQNAIRFFRLDRFVE